MKITHPMSRVKIHSSFYILHSSFLILHLEHVADADDEGDFVAKIGICYCYGDWSDE